MTANAGASRGESRETGTLQLAALLIAAALGVQGARAASPSCEARALARHEALDAHDLGNWEPIDDHTLLIWAKGAMRAHLVRLAQPLSGLSAAPIIVLRDGDGDRVISPCGRDAVTLPGPDGGAARIASMELLSAKRTAELDRSDPTLAEALHRT